MRKNIENGLWLAAIIAAWGFAIIGLWVVMTEYGIGVHP